MMMDWKQYHKEVGARIGTLMKVSPDTIRGYQTRVPPNSQTTTRRENASADLLQWRHHALRRVASSYTPMRSQSRSDQRRNWPRLSSCRCHERGSALVYSSRMSMPWKPNHGGPRRLICDISWTSLL